MPTPAGTSMFATCEPRDPLQRLARTMVSQVLANTLRDMPSAGRVSSDQACAGRSCLLTERRASGSVARGAPQCGPRQ